MTILEILTARFTEFNCVETTNSWGLMSGVYGFDRENRIELQFSETNGDFWLEIAGIWGDVFIDEHFGSLEDAVAIIGQL